MITILAVLVIFAAVGVYPIVASQYGIKSPSWLMEKQLKLGLDLKGGVHLVLRVQTDDALRIETDQAAERLRDALRTKSIPASITTPGRSHRSRSKAFRPRRTPPSVMRRPICRPTSTVAPAPMGATPST